MGRLGGWTADQRSNGRSWRGRRSGCARRLRASRGTRALGRRLGGVGIGVGAGALARAGELRWASPARHSWSVHSATQSTGDPAFRRVLASVSARLRASDAVASVVPPRPGATVSRRVYGHRHCRLERNADRGRGRGGRAEARPGAARQRRRLGLAHWRLGDVVGLQRGKQGGDAQVRADLWPVTLAILVVAAVRLARRRRAATAADNSRSRGQRGLLGADARLRHLDLGDELRAHVRARARDRLRALRRPPLPRRVLRIATSSARGRRRGRWTPPARSLRPDRADLALRGDACSEPAFRSMALGIMLSVVLVLPAALTLLPAVLAKLGPRVDALALAGAHGRALLRPLSPVGASVSAPSALYGAAATLVLVLLALPALGLEDGDAVDQGRPPRRRLTRRLRTGPAGVRRRQSRRASARRSTRRRRGGGRGRGPRRRHRPSLAAPAGSGGQRSPRRSRRKIRQTLRRGRDDRPPPRHAAGVGHVGGAVAENHDLEAALAAKTRS